MSGRVEKRKVDLIVALDVPGAAEAAAAVRRMPDEIKYYKVGFQLFIREGPAVARMLQKMGKRVFLDLKLHDIPNTVAAAVKSAAELDAAFLTAHACGGRAMLKAAAEAAAAAGARAPRLLAVTALTSLSEAELAEIGVARGMAAHVSAMARLAVECGIPGIVASVLETRMLRASFGAALTIVTPGVRPGGKDAADQKRAATPAEAVKAGADYLVVGRPILAAPDPAEAARAILREISQTEEQSWGKTSS